MARTKPDIFRQPIVGKCLRELREHSELTRAELAKSTGVTTSSIVRLEGGQDVRLSTYFSIVSYYLTHAPRGWMIAERFALLTPARRGELIAVLDRLGAEGDARD